MTVGELHELEEVKILVARGQEAGILTFADVATALASRLAASSSAAASAGAPSPTASAAGAAAATALPAGASATASAAAGVTAMPLWGRVERPRQGLTFRTTRESIGAAWST